MDTLQYSADHYIKWLAHILILNKRYSITLTCNSVIFLIICGTVNCLELCFS